MDTKITEEENKSVKELQKRLLDVMDPELLDDDYYILRFLRDREGNLEETEKMLKKHLEFRRKYDVKNILNFKFTEVINKYFSYTTIAYDKEGCPVRFCPVGNLDVSGVLASCKTEEVIKFVISEFEKETLDLKEQSKKLGKIIDKCVYIYDYQNFSFAQATDKKVLQIIIIILNTFINNYPERMKACYAINTPIYFGLIYSILKAVVPSKILKRIHLYSDDSYKKDILEVIDADVLPKFLGGNRTDPDGDPLCKSIINHGGEKVPENYYIRKNKQPLSKLPGVKKVSLSSAAFHEDFLEVEEPGSFLEWEFETKCRDIGFGLFYQEKVDDEEKITELVPIQRIDTEDYPETGAYRCDTSGTYVIVFDNTYSLVRSKEIYFRTKVVTPKEHEAEIEDQAGVADKLSSNPISNE